MTAEIVTVAALVVLAGIALVTSLLSLLLNTERSRQWWADWFQGISTEMVGAIVTAILLGVIVGLAQERDADANLRIQLVRQMSSQVNNDALRATEELRARGWLTDGTLQDEVILGANLTGANLNGADLGGVNFTGTTLQGADLRNANLSGGNLANVNLEAANLLDANLRGARLDGTRFDVNTTLPDGERWRPNVDMSRHTGG